MLLMCLPCYISWCALPCWMLWLCWQRLLFCLLLWLLPGLSWGVARLLLLLAPEVDGAACRLHCWCC
jgi:hypothetical protein